MASSSEPEDPEVEEALDALEEAYETGGIEAAKALLESMPAALRERVEPRFLANCETERELEQIVAARNTSEDDACDAVGKTGRYELLGIHAIGGMGVVFRARDSELRRIVAYKAIKNKYRSDRVALERFQQEVEVTARLQHPGIVSVLGFVKDESGLPAYAMEFVGGQTLTDAIRHYHDSACKAEPGRPALEALLRHFISACRIVAYAHSENIVHGDLKPPNIVVDQYDALRVVDWGVSRFVLPEGAPAGPGADVISRRVFTPNFAGPTAEQPGRLADFKSDVHALGATLYYLLTGEVQSHDAGRDRTKLDRMPQPLAAVCRKAMEPLPEQRYADPIELAEDVERFLDDKPNSVYVDPLPTRARRWVDRHRTATVSALLLFLFGCIGTVAVNFVTTAARREQNRIRYEAGRERERVRYATGRGPIEVLLSLGVNQYFRKNQTDAADTYDNLIRQADQRLSSEFATEADTALLARCFFARGFIELPGQLPTGENAAQFGSSLIEQLLAVQRSRGLLTAALDTRDNEKAIRAEPWMDKAISTFESIRHPEKLDSNKRATFVDSLLARAIVRMQLGRHTEALMDWDRCMLFQEMAVGPFRELFTDVVRKAAEMEQANPAWSRPPKAQDPKTMKLADYLAERQGVSDAAIYNAACVFSLASLDERATATERDRRAARAITYLGRIADRGYFRGKKQLGELVKGDDDLEPVRARPDFQALSSKVQAAH